MKKQIIRRFYWPPFLLLLFLLLTACNQILEEPLSEIADDSELELQGLSWNAFEPAESFFNVISSTLAFSALDHPIVAYDIGYISPRGYDNNVYVKKWNGTAWDSLGKHLDTRQGWKAKNPSISVGSNNNIFVTWCEITNTSTGGGNIYVKVWDNSTWQLLGGPLDNTISGGAKDPAIVLDNQNRPVITWVEMENTLGGTYNFNIFVKRWNGQQWESLGEAVGQTPPYGYGPSIAVNYQDKPFIAWVNPDEAIQVSRWNGHRWIDLHTITRKYPSRKISSPQIALIKSRGPVVVWSEYDFREAPHHSGIYVSRWKGALQSWESLGGAVNTYQGINARFVYSLLIDNRNRLRVAWQDLDYNLYVSHWRGPTNEWLPLGAQPIAQMRNNAGSISLKSDSSAMPHVAFKNVDQDLLIMKFE